MNEGRTKYSLVFSIKETERERERDRERDREKVYIDRGGVEAD